ncbi:MAG TPA: hypothetical protein VH684_28325 [Xanthobacteraceae bacterium]|jgi:hypothetical protein
MTNLSLAVPSFAEREFRVGSAMTKTTTVLARNLLKFSIVTAIASLPTVLLFGSRTLFIRSPTAFAWSFAGFALWPVLYALSQAIVLYGAFENIRGRPVDLVASFVQASRRFLPVIGVGLVTGLLGGLGILLLIIPGLFLLTIWYVATPVCVVERIGPWKSLRRSEALTKGSRWKIFGMMVLVVIITLIGKGLIVKLTLMTGATVGLLANLIWSALIGAFSAILGVVTYRDLRVAKEGIDTDQIAAVFD